MKLGIGAKKEMASSLQSSLGLISRSKPKLKFHKYQHVRAQALGDEGGAGRSINMVDANMSALRERIENIRTKERLQRCYRVEQAGWCYSSGYDYKLKRDAKLSESLEFMVLVGKTFGLTIATSSSLLFIMSVILHLRFLGQ